jgi:glycosyltransferase involved in cell wall biosynthesis
VSPKSFASFPIILFVGRVFKEKGVDHLIRACALLKQDFNLVVVGDGWDLERCKSIAHDLGLQDKVDFKGFLPSKKVARLYQQSRIVAVPSVWPEPFCLTGLEAMSYKKPVVAYDSGGISQWLRNGKNGFLVERLSGKGLAEKLDLLLKDVSLAEKMGNEGYNIVRDKFTFKRHLDELEELFEKVVSAR